MLFQPILTSTLSLLALSFGFTFTAPAAAPAPAPAPDTPIAIREVSTTETLDPRSFSSRITWYYTGLGACGTYSNDEQFDPSTPNGNPNRNSLCGRRIRVNANGRSVTATLVDRCTQCPYGGLDLSPAAFSVLASTDVGVVQGSWDWV
ncbi:RlpA-like double-psi beta-barrel-containing domain-containing protein [Neurospora intermedia]|uniref:RlpA-like double-psi beta-barrel-containing domain-containing protein n=1 Tax=Neurospora intermedia TaxID=5142 RepID=A0ABR3D5L5_NEUIN